MSSLTKVKSVEFAVHAHATEDVRKVMKAVENLVPREYRSMLRYEKQELEGHHGNPITRITAILEDRAAEDTVRYIASRLSMSDKLLLDTSFESRYDEKEGKLYLRLSKQDAYLGRIRVLDGDDVIRVVVSFRGAPSASRAREIARELGLLP